MKMTYSKPQAQVINLYAEDTMLAGSGTVSFDVDKTNTTDVVMSDQQGWSSDSWSADED